MARIGDTPRTSLKSILEAVLLAAGEPLDRNALASVFAIIRVILAAYGRHCDQRELSTARESWEPDSHGRPTR